MIHGCIINHTNQTPAVTLSGISGPEPLVRCKFTDNIVIGGNIFCTDVNQLTIQNNTVRVTSLGTGQHIPIHVALGGDSVIITGNLLVNDDPATRSVISLEGKRQVTRALVANNLCFARAGIGIQCLSSDDVAIQGNLIVATDSCNNGILVRSESSDVDNISVRDNDVQVQGTGKWKFGIRIAATKQHHVGHISIIGNSIRGASKGVVYESEDLPQNKRFQQLPVSALNRIAEDVSTPFDGIENLPFESIIVGGVTSTGGTTAKSGAGRFIAGLGDPNNRVPGNVGDIFQRLDGIPGETLYVKEKYEDDNPTTGWAKK